VIH
jgi:ATP-binding cassette subfamily C (CFTR/MRP) protein 1